MELQFDWGVFLQPLLELVVTVLLGLLFKYVVNLINAFVDERRATEGFKKFETAVGIVRQLVMAAEQAGLTGALKNIGEEKKRYVFDLAEAELKRRGITLDLDVLDALIEAQVKEAIKDLEPPLGPAESA